MLRVTKARRGGGRRRLARAVATALAACIVGSLGIVAGTLSSPANALSATATAPEDGLCPAGEHPAPIASMGELYLLSGALPYTMVSLDRLVVDPGDAVPELPGRPAMYFVQSGILEYETQPWTAIMAGAPCIPDDGPMSMEGSTSTGRDGFTSVSPGQALVADRGLTGTLRNGSSELLVILRVLIVAPDIDPASGLPIVDPMTAAREQNRAREIRKQACKDLKRQAALTGTPVDPTQPPFADVAATPTFSTAGWSTDAEGKRETTPRNCKLP